MPDLDPTGDVPRSYGLRLRSIRDDVRECDFVASTDAVDSYDEVVDQTWRLERFKANPVVLFAHRSRELPIGSCTRVEVTGGQLECTIKFASERANPLAEQVWRCIQEKTLRAVSVGFLPNGVRLEKRNGQEVYVLSDNELFEISVTPIPANPGALAKMKAHALQIAHARDPSPRHVETPMTEVEEKALRDKIVQREADVRAAEDKVRASDDKARGAEKALGILEERAGALTLERDAAISRAEKAEGLLLEREVEALVGTKIVPAEKDAFLELARTNRGLFERMVSQRSPLKVLDQVVKTDKATPAVPNLPSPDGRELAEAINKQLSA